MTMFVKTLSRLLCLSLAGCMVDIPDVPKAELKISSVSPAENSNVDDNSNLSVGYSWNIAKYDAAKTYVMQILLYDVNTERAYISTSFPLNAASGTRTDTYSGRTFYNCILGCVRKAALPFRVYFTVEQKDNVDADYGTTLARTREYTYK